MLVNFLFEKVIPRFKKQSKILDSEEVPTVQDLLTYPPKVYGVPTLSAEQVVSFHSVQIKSLIPSARMRLTAEYDEPCFDNLYKETLSNFAEYCHLLPASEFHHHHEVGGLFYHSMETALGCLEYAKARDGDIPKDENEYAIDIQSQLKPVWHYAAWCLGLLHDLGKIVIDMKVISADKESNCPPWDALNETLMEWAEEHNVKRYRPIWNPHRNHQEHQCMSGVLFQKIVSKAGQRYLGQGGAKVRTQVINYLNGRIDTQAFLHKLVLEVDSKVTKEDMSMRWDRNLGDIKIGIEKAFISTLKILKPKLKVNTANGSVFVVGGSVFIKQDLLNKIIQTCKKEGYNSIPSESKVFALTLIERGIITPYSDDYWFYNLTSNELNAERAVQVVELASPILFFDGKIPKSITGTLQISPIDYICNINEVGEKTVLEATVNLNLTTQITDESTNLPAVNTPEKSKSSDTKQQKEQPKSNESAEQEKQASGNRTDAQKAASKIAALKKESKSPQHFALKTTHSNSDSSNNLNKHSGDKPAETISEPGAPTKKSSPAKKRRTRKTTPEGKLNKKQLAILGKLKKPTNGWQVKDKQIHFPVEHLRIISSEDGLSLMSQIKTEKLCCVLDENFVFSEPASQYLINKKGSDHSTQNISKDKKEKEVKTVNLADIELQQSHVLINNNLNIEAPVEKGEGISVASLDNSLENNNDSKIENGFLNKLKEVSKEFDLLEHEGGIYMKTDNVGLLRRKLTQSEFKMFRTRTVVTTEIEGVRYMLIYKEGQGSDKKK